MIMTLNKDIKSHLMGQKQTMKTFTYLATKDQQSKLSSEISKNSADHHKIYSISSSSSLDHAHLLKSLDSTFEIIDLDSTQMEEWTQFLKNDLLASESSNVEILILFESNLKLKNKRLLEEEEEEDEQEEKEKTQDQERFQEKRSLAVAALVLRPSPVFISGFCFGLFALVILLIGVCSLYGVKSPDKFARFPLIVGKES